LTAQDPNTTFEAQLSRVKVQNTKYANQTQNVPPPVSSVLDFQGCTIGTINVHVVPQGVHTTTSALACEELRSE